MTLLSMHTMRPARGAKSKSKVVGRGNASGKGTTAGRGGKGQTARTGGRNKLKLLGMRHIILATPKLRGFKSQHAKSAIVGLGQINSAYAAGEMVNLKTLMRKRLIPMGSASVKILGGTLKKKLVFSGCNISESAKQKITTVGGEVRA